MDESREKIDSKRDKIKDSTFLWIFRRRVNVAFCFMVSCFVSFVFGMYVLFIGGSSGLYSSISVQSRCRIIASDVDLRSSKICELSLPNCKARYPRYPSGKVKIMCHEDYYWASVFKVEYKEYFSGRMIHGVAESPKEALPTYCRPNFNRAWGTKSRFKVNETYHCRYSLGSFKADIYPDHLFNCQAGNPSSTEMMQKLFTLFLSSFKSLSWDTLLGWRNVLAVATGSGGGFIFSMLAISGARILQARWPEISKKLHPATEQIPILAMQLRRPIILLAYVMTVIWFVLQYIYTLGLQLPLFDSLSRTEVMR